MSLSAIKRHLRWIQRVLNSIRAFKYSPANVNRHTNYIMLFREIKTVLRNIFGAEISVWLRFNYVNFPSGNIISAINKVCIISFPVDASWNKVVFQVGMNKALKNIHFNATNWIWMCASSSYRLVYFKSNYIKDEC